MHRLHELVNLDAVGNNVCLTWPIEILNVYNKRHWCVPGHFVTDKIMFTLMSKDKECLTFLLIPPKDGSLNIMDP